MNEYERDLYNGPLISGQSQPGPVALAWLAGFIDGEGTISLNVYGRSDRSPGRIHPRLSLPNTNLQNMGRARYLLTALLGYDLQIGEHRPKSGHRPVFVISMQSHFAVDVVLRAVYPYLVGKWEHAHVVLEFLTIAPGSDRNKREFQRVRGRAPAPGQRYDERHWALVERIRLLNRRYPPNTWAAEREAKEKPEHPPGYRPMDPLKRWYKLHGSMF